jgi:hemerythrin
LAIQWNDSYVTGIKTVDEQHKALFEMLNGFYAALRQKRTQESLLELLDSLVGYTHYHFTTEEELMAKYGFLLSLDHISQHRDFIEKITDWNKRAANGQLLISLEVTNYLRDWLVEHIAIKDRSMCAYLKGRGVN